MRCCKKKKKKKNHAKYVKFGVSASEVKIFSLVWEKNLILRKRPLKICILQTQI